MYDKIDFGWLVIGWAVAMFAIFVPIIGYAVNDYLKEKEKDHD